MAEIQDTREVIVRPGTGADVEAVKTMWQRLFALHQAWGYAFPVNADMATEWAKSFEKTLGRFAFLYIGEVDGAACGFLLMRLLFAPAHCGRVTVAHIGELYVDESRRGAGIGRRLVEAAFATAAEMEVHSVEVQTMVANAKASAFWEALGMSPEFVQFRRRLRP